MATRLRAITEFEHRPIAFRDEPLDDVSANDTERTNNDRLFLHPFVSLVIAATWKHSRRHATPTARFGPSDRYFAWLPIV